MSKKKSAKEQTIFDFELPKPNLRQLMGPDDLFASANEELLRDLQEDNRIERKPSRFSGSSLGEYLCMWANSPPDGGLIVIGMLDDGAFDGCTHLPQESLNKLEKVGEIWCSEARIETKRIAVTNQHGVKDFVILFRVYYHENIVVKTNSGKVFRRIGDSKKELRPPEVRELQIDKGEVSFEQEDCREQWPDGFNQRAVAEFVEGVRSARGLSPELTKEGILISRRLARDDRGQFKPNQGCLLLFSNDPLRTIPGCKVRFQKFDGEQEGTGNKYNAVKDEILEGTIPELIQQAERLLDLHLRTFSPLDAKGKFYPVPEYPKAAWYEAIVNACVHRSYGNGLRNMQIFVKMFDDRLVVESPGGFPPFVTPKTIYDRQHARNPHLMAAMFYLNYVKCAREGARRMRDTMTQMSLPEPEFEQSESELGSALVRVVLRNKIKQRRAWIDSDVSGVVGEALASTLSENEIRILNWAAEHGKITISDANKLLDVSWQSAKKLLFALAHRKVLQYIRFRPHERNLRDPRAFFRIRSAEPLPEGGIEESITSNYDT